MASGCMKRRQTYSRLHVLATAASFSPADLEQIARKLQVRCYPGDHQRRSAMVEFRRLDERAEFPGTRLERWRADWESLDTDRYLAHYSPISPRRTDLDGWSRHKRMVNSGKTWIKVKVAISGVRRPGQGRLVSVTFDQEYRSSNLRTSSKAPVLAARGKRLADHLRGTA